MPIRYHEYQSLACPKHPKVKMAETMMGERWCPKCEGQRMARETIARIKPLTLRLPSTQ